MNSEVATICTIRFANKGAYMSYLNVDPSIHEGDYVIVETPRGIELGQIFKANEAYDPSSAEGLTFIMRRADDTDLEIQRRNEDDCKEILLRVQKESDKLNLHMKIVSCEYTLDKAKLLITYLAEDRVDFRELLKVLASLYHCRIDLRQIGSRDKAKVVGGIGVCGLPLCCATFLNEFDGISITMAKNQMLALNIPKLSGHCGKLICCLKYEDEAYSEAKKELPRVGLRVKYEDETYKITSINILTQVVRLENPNSVVTLSYNELDKIEIISVANKGNPKEKENKESEE